MHTDVELRDQCILEPHALHILEQRVHIDDLVHEWLAILLHFASNADNQLPAMPTIDRQQLEPKNGICN